MEEPYRTRIENSIYTLSKITECSEPLLVFLMQEKVLIRQDVEVININALSFDKAHKLYDILLKRPGSYNSLMEGLRETHQLGVIEILEKSSSTSAVSPSREATHSEQSPTPSFVASPPQPPSFSALSTPPIHSAFQPSTLPPPYPSFYPNIELPPTQSQPTQMPMPTFNFGFTPTSTPSIMLESHKQEQTQNSAVNFKNFPVNLQAIHKSLFRCHSKYKPLMISLITFDDAKRYLASVCDQYCDAYQHVYDHIMRFDAEDKAKLVKDLLRIADQHEVAVTNALRLNLSTWNSGDIQDGDEDITSLVNQLFEHFIGQRCIFIFENLKQKEARLLSSVLGQTPNGHVPTLITTPAMDLRNWKLFDAEVMELTEKGKILKRANIVKDLGNMFGGRLIGRVIGSNGK